jgi:hypothetical protein
MLAGLLACAAAVALPASAQAAPTGVNVSFLNNNGDPYVHAAGNLPGEPSDVARTWTDLEQSGVKSVRSFAQWSTLRGPTGVMELAKFRQFAQKAQARGMRVLLTVTGDATSMATPGEYAAVATDLARTLTGLPVTYEVWNEPDETTFWRNGPQPAEYAALLKAAYPAFKAGDPNAKVLVGGLVGNNYDFLQALYDNGAKGAFDGVGVHTDTACLTTDPREYYREPSGRIGRYSFTGYREVRRTMVDNGDADKTIWMTELGWASTTSVCSRGGRAGTKEGGVSRELQADFLTKAYGCLANDPYVEQALWFNLHDIKTGSPDDSLNLGLITDDFTRKPAFAAMQRAATQGPIECGGTMDSGAPAVHFAAPTDGAQYLTTLPIDIRATDGEGVTDIDLHVDGKEIPLSTKRSGKDASVKFEWGGAKNLSYGPHKLVATASDEGKNVGRAEVTVIHVGGGAYKLRVATKLQFRVGKVKGGKVRVRGKVLPQGNVIAPKANGSVWIRFFKKQGGRWKKVSLYRKDAKRAFAFTHRLKARGKWKVTAEYKPKAGFRGSKARALSLRF